MKTFLTDDGLTAIVKRDACSFDFQPLPKLTALCQIQFTCECGKLGLKQLQNIVKFGGFCSDCTEEHKILRIKKLLPALKPLNIIISKPTGLYHLTIKSAFSATSFTVLESVQCDTSYMLDLTARVSYLSPVLRHPTTRYKFWSVTYVDLLTLESHIKSFHVDLQNPVQSETRARDFISYHKSQIDRFKNYRLLKNIKDVYDRHDYYAKRFGISLVKEDFPAQDVPLDPYFVGLWAGDGTHDKPEITTVDDVIIEYLHEYADSLGMYVQHAEGTIAYKLSDPKKGFNYINSRLRALGLLKYKHIPQIYLENSRSVRLAFLAGLLDSDGHRREVSYTFAQSKKHERLYDDTIELCRSLGFLMTKKPIMAKMTYKNIEREFPAFIGHIAAWADALQAIPVKLPRKCVQQAQIKRRDLLAFIIKKL